MAFPSTFQNLQQDVIGRLNLDATGDLAYVKDALNAAYYGLCQETEALVTSGSFTLTAGTASYDLTSLAAAVQRIMGAQVTSGGVTFPPLLAVSLDEILRLRVSTGGTATATGTSSRYALVGAKALELWPTPQAADTLKVWYTALPTALSGNSDVPDASIPEPYATRLLVFGACAECADLTGDPSGDSYRQMYEAWLGKLRAHLLRRRSHQPGQFRPFAGGGSAPHDPATITPFDGSSAYSFGGG